MARLRRFVCGAWLAGAVLLAGSAALADVKDGADAWSRGDYAAAIREWQGPAAAGDPDAQFNLAQAYRLGRGVERDLVRAEQLFGKAAAQGHVQAADNYGLLMFDRGERAAAMPYVRAAADRGDPRAQYLLGIALFNGELAPRDWTRAYALMTLAQAAGLPQAAPALAQMDQFIPLAQRQSAAGLATRLAQATDANRATQIAAANLAGAPAMTVPTAPPRLAPPAPATPPIVRPESAVASAVRTAGTSGAATAGADFARPEAAARTAVPPLAAPPAKPAPVPAKSPVPKLAAKPVPPPAAKPPAAKPTTVGTGSWRVQLGAFAVPGNADALWAKAARRPELAGHPRINAKAGSAVKLQAGGFASRAAASGACAALIGAGFACVPAQD